MSAARSANANFWNTAGSNIAFVSSETFGGNLGGLAGADGQCARLATAANLAGSYKAWLSSSTIDARDRFAGARVWSLPDGRLIADTLTDLNAGKMAYPIHQDENGNIVDDEKVWTNTLGTGLRGPGAACSDWTTSSISVFSSPEGYTSGGPRAWSQYDSLGFVTACSVPKRLYCLGTATNGAPFPIGLPGKIAFVSSVGLTPGAGGVTSLDNRCVLDASNASLSGTFKALVATTSTAASTKLDMGADYLSRAGGYLGRGSDIAAGRVRAGAWATAAGVIVGLSNEETWSGASLVTGVGSTDSTCADWTSTSGSLALSGLVNLGSTGWWRSQTGLCNRALRVYCFQQ